MVKTLHAFCVKIAGYLSLRTGQPERASVLAYGLELLLGEISKITVLYVLAALLGILPTTVMVNLSTISFRLVSGGKHSASHLGCLITTLIVFLSTGWLAGTLLPLFSGSKLLLILLPAYLYIYFAIYKWAPVSNNHRKHDTPAAKKKFRRLSYIVVTGWYVIGVIFMLLAGDTPLTRLYLTGTTTGLLLQGFSISPIGDRLGV